MHRRRRLKKYRPIALRRLKRYSLKERKSKVDHSALGKPTEVPTGIQNFIETLPDILAAKDLKEVIQTIVKARKGDRPVVLGMGAHPVKVGLSPLIIDAMKEGIITAIATNGATVVHDFEMAYQGQTSEDVLAELSDGSFGMARETGRLLNRAIKKGAEQSLGLGEAVGKMIWEGRFPYKDLSVLATAFRLDIPFTVHVAIGTDIIHMHPECDGKSLGETSYRDFKKFISVVADLEGGVFINLGSSVLIPEVFLKAVTVARNLGSPLKNITTLTMDFMRHYRPMVNVVQRPTAEGGRGYYITGHHEIMFPLLLGAVKERLAISAS